METLIIIALVVASLIWNALQKRKQEEEEGKPWLPPLPRRPAPDQSQPPGEAPTPARPRKTGSWEEELRRLLQGEPPEPAPPPVIVRAPSPAPPPLPRTVPTTAMPSEEGQAEPAESESPLSPWLTRSAQAFQRGHQLEAAVAERLRKVDAQLLRHKAVLEQREKSLDISRALSLLRDRPSQRAAVIVSVVLGPPRSLES